MTKESEKGLVKVSKNVENDKPCTTNKTELDIVDGGSVGKLKTPSPGKENKQQQQQNSKNRDNIQPQKTSLTQGLQQQGSSSAVDLGSGDSPDIGIAVDPMGLPSEQLLVPNLPSTNGHENGSGSVKNGLKRNGSGRQKCRCWCCCCSCSCLALKNNEPKGKESESDLICDPDPPPSLDEIRTWGESFDRLMRSSGGRKVFRDFLKCEYSEENILFWLACEELKKERIPEVIEEKARLIYEDYISILSPKEVSLDSRVRDVVNQNMRNPKPSTFDEAQLQIYTLMHRDSYPRFVNSPLYKKLAQLNSSPTGTPAGSGNPPALPGAGSHRGSTISVTSPTSRKQSAAS